MLKGKASGTGDNILLRKGLVGFQFATAIVVLVGAIIISKQISLFFSANYPDEDFSLEIEKRSSIEALIGSPNFTSTHAAIASLERADMNWSIGYASNTLPDLWSAVKLGLGIAVRTPAAVPTGLTILDSKHGLPDLRPFRVSLCGPATETRRPIADRLRVILEECLSLSVQAPT